MSKRIHLSVIFVLLVAMVLGACAPAAQPTTEAPVVEAPVATEVPTSVPTLEPVVEAPDFNVVFTDVIAQFPKDKGYGTVAFDALNTELVDNANLFLLDVREPSELEADGYIEGAVAIPVRDVLDNLDKLPGLDEPIVVYCKSGHRGVMTMNALAAIGYTNIRNLAGGLNAWVKAELPVVKDAVVAPEVISTPIVENEALFTALRDFMANLPEGFYNSAATAVNEMIINAETLTLVDVRRPDEFEKGYVEGATNIPLEDFVANYATQLPDKDAKIVVYCGSGQRSVFAAMTLLMNGYTNVVNMGGGLGAWKTAELPVYGAAPDFTKLFATLIEKNNAEVGYGTIAADVLNTELVENPDLFLLDVREAAEFETDGYIESANFAAVPVRSLLENLDKLPALDTPIVVYCKSGHRGAFAMNALQLMGYTNVRNLAGGIGAWKKAEFPVVVAAAPVAEAISTPIVADQQLYTALNGFLTALPEGFFATNAAALNEMLVNMEAIVLVDVRRAEEFAEGHIEGAVNIPLEELMANLALLPDKTAKTVVYCKSGHRAAIATQALIQNGFTNVLNLGGGMGAWLAAELPTVQ